MSFRANREIFHPGRLSFGKVSRVARHGGPGQTTGGNTMRRIVASLAALGMLAAAPQAGAQDLVVGVSALMTGQSAGTYAPVVEAMRLYFDGVNKAGGINGRQVRLLISDNQADASKAAADAKKFLLQDN